MSLQTFGNITGDTIVMHHYTYEPMDVFTLIIKGTFIFCIGLVCFVIIAILWAIFWNWIEGSFDKKKKDETSNNISS